MRWQSIPTLAAQNCASLERTKRIRIKSAETIRMSKLALYYILLAAIVIGKAGHTLYERSLVVHHGFTVSEYHSQQKELQQKKAQLVAQLAEQRSIVTVKNSATISDYTPISTVFVVTASRNVASLQ